MGQPHGFALELSFAARINTRHLANVLADPQVAATVTNLCRLLTAIAWPMMQQCLQGIRRPSTCHTWRLSRKACTHLDNCRLDFWSRLHNGQVNPAIHRTSVCILNSTLDMVSPLPCDALMDFDFRDLTWRHTRCIADTIDPQPAYEFLSLGRCFAFPPWTALCHLRNTGPRTPLAIPGNGDLVQASIAYKSTSWQCTHAVQQRFVY